MRSAVLLGMYGILAVTACAASRTSLKLEWTSDASLQGGAETLEQITSTVAERYGLLLVASHVTLPDGRDLVRQFLRGPDVRRPELDGSRHNVHLSLVSGTDGTVELVIGDYSSGHETEYTRALREELELELRQAFPSSSLKVERERIAATIPP